jgi:stearoyl-CoA desaturase (delta-9 desaturase)
MAIQKLKRPRSRNAALALVGYPIVTLLPLFISWGFLELVRLTLVENLPVFGILVVLFLLRTFNVYVVSSLHHKSLSHRAFRYHPVLERFLRVWGWLFIGTGVRAWAILHRWHHARADTVEDPHSPTKPGESLWTVPRQTFRSYQDVLFNPEKYKRYSKDLPDDRLEAFISWGERNNFGIFGVRMALLMALGIGSLAAVWGLAGGTAVFFASLPTIIGGVYISTVFTVNGLCHVIGYQNFDTTETSTNLFPVDILGWGEALHHNHHASPRSANLAVRPWEWDPGYAALRILSLFGLVRDIYVPKSTAFVEPKDLPGLEDEIPGGEAETGIQPAG